MQSLQIISSTLDQIFQSGATTLYHNYLTTKLPRHLNQNQFLSVKQTCNQQFPTADTSSPIPLDHQPHTIHRDNLALKQIKKRSTTIIKSPNKNNEKQKQKSKVKVSGRYSTRPTTAGKSMSSTFSKMKFSTEEKLIRLQQEIVIDNQYQRFENQMRRCKKLEMEKMKELEERKKVEDARKVRESGEFEKEFEGLKERGVKTTWGFDGGLLGVTGKSINRKIPAIDISVKDPKPQKIPTVQKTAKSRGSEKHSTEFSQKDVFTSLVYEMNSTKGSTKLESRFHRNDEYNNNNIRQTSHVNFIQLNQGVSLYQPINMVNIHNTINPQRQTLPTKTATFKHFLIPNSPPTIQNQDSLELKQTPEFQDNENIYQTNKKELAEARTYLQSKDSSRFRSTLGNRFSSSFYRPMTAESGDYRKKPVRPRTSNNNGTEKIVVSENMRDIIVSEIE